MFIDNITIYIKAGDGGNGVVSFRREKFAAHGGPDGGDGGHGGDIIFSIAEGSNTLLAFRYKRKFIAKNGEKGSGCKFHGASSEDLIVKVPPGTLIKDAKTGKIIHDMSSNNSADFVCARGGRGGWGNTHFATPTRQVPNFAKSGTKGEEKDITLELKMLADVGLIGFPNVGKSSILSKISAAKPKIADYHFTTLSPNLGMVRISEEKCFVAADIPGLIEGAADGAGLGHEFLRHVDRCRLLLHVVDISCSEGRNPIDDIKKINIELTRYSTELGQRPQIIVANKTDILDENVVDIKAFEKYIDEQGYDLIYVSAITGKNLDELISMVGEKLKLLPPMMIYETELTEEDAYVGGGKETTIRRENDTFYVEGAWLVNLMGQINFDDYESLNFFQHVLQRSGVIAALEEKGCKDGDTVSIYDFEFNFIK